MVKEDVSELGISVVDRASPGVTTHFLETFRRYNDSYTAILCTGKEALILNEMTPWYISKQLGHIRSKYTMIILYSQGFL